jgi:hypothetical protein
MESISGQSRTSNGEHICSIAGQAAQLRAERRITCVLPCLIPATEIFSNTFAGQAVWLRVSEPSSSKTDPDFPWQYANQVRKQNALVLHNHRNGVAQPP